MMKTGLSFEEEDTIREFVRKREDYKCYFCEKKLISYRNSTHDIIPRCIGGIYSKDNCICICNKCHNKIERLNKRLLKYIFKTNTYALTILGLKPSVRELKSQKQEKKQ